MFRRLAAACSVATTSAQQPEKPKEPAKDKPQVMTAEAREFITAKLKELDGFKTDPKFIKLGFGTGGPYNKWLVAVDERQKAATKPSAEGIALGDLSGLGLAYVSSKGQETKFTRFAREEIEKAIAVPK